MERSVPSRNLVTGFEVEKQSFTWTIKDFPLVRQWESMIDSQTIDFTARETTGRPSHFEICLEENMEDGKRWIGIYLNLKSPKPTDASFKSSHFQIRFSIKDQKGKTIQTACTRMMHIPTKFAESPGWGTSKFIDANNVNFCPEESLVIHVSFKLYTPSQAKLPSSLEAIKEKFQVTFLDQRQRDFDGLLDIPDPSTDIKIVSSDKMEFTMKKGILTVRSEVFAAMLRSDMAEANSGVIKLPEISSKALAVFLNFLKTGALLPEWSETGVILELTNAAAEYQLKDLLQFLDATLGKVCQLENVLDLAVLARQLSLKVAEEELMMFVRKEGVGSLDNVFQMWNTEVPGIDSAPRSAAVASSGQKRLRLI